MSDSIEWALYNFRSIASVDSEIKSKPLQSMKNAIWTDTLIRLVHYCMNQPVFPLKKYMFWTEVITDEPLLASEAIGIPASECVWRIEWSFPAQEAEAFAKPLQKRMSTVGTYTEYKNLITINLQDCTIQRL